MDYIEFDDGFAIVKMAAPKLAHHKTLAESGHQRAEGGNAGLGA